MWKAIIFDNMSATFHDLASSESIWEAPPTPPLIFDALQSRPVPGKEFFFNVQVSYETNSPHVISIEYMNEYDIIFKDNRNPVRLFDFIKVDVYKNHSDKRATVTSLAVIYSQKNVPEQDFQHPLTAYEAYVVGERFNDHHLRTCRGKIANLGR